LSVIATMSFLVSWLLGRSVGLSVQEKACHFFPVWEGLYTNRALSTRGSSFVSRSIIMYWEGQRLFFIKFGWIYFLLDGWAHLVSLLMTLTKQW